MRGAAGAVYFSRMKAFLIRAVPVVLTLFISAVFLDSLRYKFSNHPNTENIFGILNDWAASLGAPGLFSYAGVFGPYVIGSAELLASALLLAGLVPLWRLLSALGALIAFSVMTGAVFFHLFTPLGTDPNKDGGGLFVAAVLVWLGSITLLYLRRDALLSLLPRKR